MDQDDGEESGLPAELADLAALDAEDELKQQRLNQPEALHRGARWYAEHGIAVFPLRPGDKTPAIRRAHPDDFTLQRNCRGACGRDGHGLYDATTDLDRIDQWWTAMPQANVGLPTGRLFDVLDIDGPTGWMSYTDHLLHARCPKRDDGVTPSCCDDATAPRCLGDPDLTAFTSAVYGRSLTRGDNGGMHVYLATTGDPNGRAVLPGIDYRGEGGYVVAPPSRCRLGRYSWANPLDLAAIARDAAVNDHGPAAA